MGGLPHLVKVTLVWILASHALLSSNSSWSCPSGLQRRHAFQIIHGLEIIVSSWTCAHGWMASNNCESCPSHSVPNFRPGPRPRAKPNRNPIVVKPHLRKGSKNLACKSQERTKREPRAFPLKGASLVVVGIFSHTQFGRQAQLTQYFVLEFVSFLQFSLGAYSYASLRVQLGSRRLCSCVPYLRQEKDLILRLRAYTPRLRGQVATQPLRCKGPCRYNARPEQGRLPTP